MNETDRDFDMVQRIARLEADLRNATNAMARQETEFKGALAAEVEKREKLEKKFNAIEAFTKKYGYFAAGMLFIAASGTAALDKLLAKLFPMGQ